MTIKRKLITSLVSLSLTSGGLAFDTPHVGISIGPNFQETKLKSPSAFNYGPFVAKSLYMSIFAGYDHLIQDTPLFIGLEGEIASHSSPKKKEVMIDTGATLKFSTNNSFSGAMRIGAHVGEATFYGKVGLQYTNWKISNLSRHVVHKSSNSYGNLIGGGMECAINNNTSLGIEHTYSQGGTIKVAHRRNSMQLKPTFQLTKLRLAYKF